MALRITWLGQSGLLLEDESARVLVDPWLSPHPDRAAPAPSMECLAGAIDLVLITHGHADHLDLPGLVNLARWAKLREIAAPEPHLPAIADALQCIPRVATRPYRDLDRIGGVSVVPAWHGVSVADGYGPMLDANGLSPHVGYILTLGGTRLYIAGDTLAHPELGAIVKRHGPHIAFLPINGRDEVRERSGILGNMNAVEAVDFAAAVDAAILVPLHYDGVKGNTAPVLPAVTAAVGRPVSILVLSRGETFQFNGNTP